MSIAQNYPIVSPALSLDFANVQALDPRITFARATTATYYGTRTALAEQNLLLQSQTFENASWSKLGSTVTANAAVSPDGTSTAALLISNNGSTDSYLRQEPTISTGGTDVLTVYAKYLNYQYVVVNIRTGASARYCWFDVQNGVVGTNSSGGTASMQSVGNNWYRLILSRANEGSTLRCNFYLATTDAVLTIAGDGVSGNYFWGAQFEKRDQATAYTPTTTQPITNYIPVLETAASGVARFDHNPVTFESLGLLIEEQRTNLVLQSQTFDSATWIKNGGGTAVTVIPNTIIAPDGTLTGDKLDEAGGVTQSQVILQGVTVANSTAHTFSFYAKAAERSFVYTQAQGANNFQVVFNLTIGTVGVSSGTFTAATITPVGNNWYRCAVTATSTTTSVNWFIEPQATNALGTHLGVANNGIFLWGAQLEAGAFATSYIPTVASQVTRAADSASMTGTNFSSWYNMAGGTIYGESSLVGRPNLSTGIFVQLQGAGNGYFAYQNATFTSQINIFDDTNAAGSTAGASAVNTAQKFATAFSSSGMAAIWAGGAVVTSAYNNKFATATGANLFGAVAGTANWNGRIKKLAFYPLRLTDTQLQALTT